MEEVQELIAELTAELLKLDSALRNGSGASGPGRIAPSVIDSIFRLAHSLKGVADLLGLETIARAAHAMESTLDDWRWQRRVPDTAGVDSLLVTLADCERALFRPAPEELPPGPPTAQSLDESTLAALGLERSLVSMLTEYEHHRLTSCITEERRLVWVTGHFELVHFDEEVEPFLDVLAGVGEVVLKVPDAGSDGQIGLRVLVASDLDGAALTQRLADRSITLAPVTLPARAAATEPREPPPKSPEVSARPPLATVRVPLWRFDALLGGLDEVRSVSDQLETTARQLAAGTIKHAAPVQLRHIASDLERKLTWLQGELMQARLIPIGGLLAQMARYGRQIASELCRSVRIDTEGGDTELDKMLVDELAEPLTHLVRNAIDHGVEPPAARVAAGKPACGVVTLSARSAGRRVVVRIQDDGPGIDYAAVAWAAHQRGLIPKEAATPALLHKLLFAPGFTTRERAARYSGRGVGLDMVKERMAQLGGVIEVESTSGAGTRLTLSLPITQALFSSLVARVDQTLVALPLAFVVETVSQKALGIELSSARGARVRNAEIPVHNLGHFMGTTGGSGGALAVICQVGAERCALVVDSILGHRNLVVRGLGRWLGKVPGVVGVAPVGHEGLALALDLGEVMAMVSDG